MAQKFSTRRPPTSISAPCGDWMTRSSFQVPAVRISSRVRAKKSRASSYMEASWPSGELDEHLGVLLDFFSSKETGSQAEKGTMVSLPPWRMTFQTCSWMLGEVDSSRFRVMCQVSKMRRPTTAWRSMPSTMTRSRLSITASPLFRPKRMTCPPRRTTEMAVLRAALEPDISRATSTPTPSVRSWMARVIPSSWT